MNPEQSLKEQNRSSTTPRKVVERALLLPLIGLLLFFPPIAGIFDINLFVSGIPFTVIYLFVVWGLLIFAAYRLSLSLAHLGEQETAAAERQTSEQESSQ